MTPPAAPPMFRRVVPLIWSFAILATATLLHVVIWKIRLPRRQTRTLLLLYFGCLLAALVFAQAMPAAWRPYWIDWLQIAISVVAMTLGYVITYSAVEADSPTLVMIRAIAAAGDQGLPADALFAAADDATLITPRVSDLARDGMVRLDGDRYTLLEKGRRFVSIFIRYRALLRAGKGG